jgi:hypothetical protein
MSYGGIGGTGYPYIAPKTGQTPLPFVNPSKLVFTVSVGDYRDSSPMGTLSYATQRPLFRYSPGSNAAVKNAVLTLVPSTGAFSGSILSTQTNGTSKLSTFSGVLLQGGQTPGVGLTNDGKTISFK